ncbi:MAG: hypothetical protein ABTQ34_01190 [Bdellovibrionales bacterium]
MPVLAQADIKYNPEERYLIPNAEDNEGANDVTINPIEATDLPEVLATKLRNTLKECTKDNPPIEKLKLYSYTSQQTRKKHRLPNVLVDFSALSGGNMQPCYQPYVLCQDKSCQLLGYINTGDETAWDLGFSIPILFWTTESKEIMGEKGHQRTYFKISSDTPNCEEFQGKLRDGVCEQSYEWRSKDLSLAQP